MPIKPHPYNHSGCPQCGGNDGEIRVGAVRMHCCEKHKAFWPIPAEPDTRPANWLFGLWKGHNVKDSRAK